MDEVICIREERNIKTGFLNPTAPLSLLHHPLQQILILLLILILLVCVIVLFCFVFTTKPCIDFLKPPTKNNGVRKLTTSPI
jgi:hypothetical protein